MRKAKKVLKEKGIFGILMGILSSVIEFPVIMMPGILGHGLRGIYFKKKLKKVGNGVVIDVGVNISSPQNTSIDDNTWIDKYVILDGGRTGRISIGKNVHIAPFTIINGGGNVRIGDYVGIAAGSRVFSATDSYKGGKRMSGPMIPDDERNVIRKPIVIEKDAFIGLNSVIMPGVTIGEGAIVGANSLVLETVPPWTIVVGSPAKRIKKRPSLKVYKI